MNSSTRSWLVVRCRECVLHIINEESVDDEVFANPLHEDGILTVDGAKPSSGRCNDAISLLPGGYHTRSCTVTEHVLQGSLLATSRAF